MRIYLPLQPPILEPVQDSSYRYREFLPCKALEPYVACYWTVEFDASYGRRLHRIIPDGCVDIIFDLKAPSFSKGAMVAGFMTSYETIDLTESRASFGIRFFVEQARRWIGHSISELTGRTVFLEDVWGAEASLAVEQVQEAGSVQAIIGLVESMLLEKLRHHEYPVDPLIRSGLQHLYAGRGMLSVRTLAEKLCYSERSVRRRFQKELGISPKELANIVQFQSLLQELRKGTSSALSDLAAKYGYFDQPHFIHMFKRFYGLTPHRILKQDVRFLQS